MKKLLKITAIVLGVLLLLLVLVPVVFKGPIKKQVQKTINENLNAQVSFSDLGLSLFRSFPDATLVIEDLLVVNKAPFEGDTLARGRELILEMSVMELFKGEDDPMRIDALTVNDMLLDLRLDSLGNANYDIAIKEDAPVADTTAASGFQFDMKHYEINGSTVRYHDQGSGLLLVVDELDHRGTGDFSAETSTLETFSTALVSLSMDGTNYLTRNSVELDADFGMDLVNQKFTFLKNQALVNQLPLTFDGYVQVNEQNNEVDISFKTPSSSFRNFLGVIPREYAKDIEGVETTGDFTVTGIIKGIVDETHIPTLDVKISSQNASFKYPDLPKSVNDISIAAEIKNETGISEDTYINLNDLNFRIDRDVFNARGTLRNLTGNMLVDMAVKGTVDLANLKQAYPLDLEQDLNGTLTADLTTSFDMESVEKEQYQNVKSSGTASIRNFRYSSPEFPNPINLSTVDLQMRPETISLTNLRATTGDTDLHVTGTLQNLMGYLFTDQKLKGSFQVNSDVFAINDFMVAEEEPTEKSAPATKEPAPKEAIKIPAFLDAQVDFQANRVIYDNLELRDTKGRLSIANETATLTNVTSHLFGGDIALNGSVSTGQAVPVFDMNLDLKSIDIGQSFNDLVMLQNLAPIIQALDGKLTTTLDLHGNLNNDLTPILQSIAGSALAEILGAQVNPQQTPLLARLDENLKFIDLSDLNLKDLKTRMSFNDGRVNVQPFDFHIKGIKATASGSHGFDKSMNYNLTLDVPASYLGKEIGGTLSSLSAQDLETMTVSLPVGLTGSFQNPTVNLNMEQAISNLTQSLMEKQKENLKEKGKDILGGLIGGDRNRTGQDTTATGKDTTAVNEDPIREAARNVLGGILGKKVKKDTTDQK